MKSCHGLCKDPSSGGYLPLLTSFRCQWSRLIGGAASGSSKAMRKNPTGKRLAAFKHTCNTLYQIWRNSPSLSPESPSIPLIRSSLNRLNDILRDESRGPSPHPCHSDAATSQVYLTVTKLALATHDPAVVSAAAVLLNTLIESEVDGIVDSTVFARALVDLVSHGNASTCIDRHDLEDGESKLVELVFGVANVIRLRPEILPAWFSPEEKKDGFDEPQRIDPSLRAGKEFAGVTRRDDFPLFYLLVDYVHYEGRTGDFARTGLLYIIETASKVKELERWLIESDMATLMAIGLGASYSQLSRLLISTDSHEDIPAIIALSDHTDLDNTVHHSHQGQLDAFLSYLLFWQDAIDHCKSPEVTDTLLDHFQVLFLEQLLYPSLLESSDVAGGSTSSVITYLSRILESIYQPVLVNRILNFLLASPASEQQHIGLKSTKKSRMSLSRRKSLDILASFAEAAAKPSPTLFNLVDLILMGIRSHNRQTVVATLRLITVVIQHHHEFANLLIKSARDQGSHPTELRTVAALNAEVQRLFTFATNLLDDPGIEPSYENYISCALSVLYQRMHSQSHVLPWLVDTRGGVFSGMLDLLRRFFTNSVVTNLALTNSFSALASSDLISLDGWLLPYPEEHAANGQTEDSAAAVAAATAATTATNIETEPVLSAILQQLVQQVENWRTDISDFDLLLAARRELLHREDQSEATGTASQQAKDEQHQSVSATDEPDTESAAAVTAATTTNPREPSPTAPQLSARVNVHPPAESTSPSTALLHPLSRTPSSSLQVVHETPGSSTAPSEAGETEAASEKEDEASLNHILTNVVILYEFILEITALVQARASVLQDVRF
ncbi:hypothetical protein MGYG_02561 [Nannizzia gypsea CBS 118893]|uniref:FHF complex subunit HOOK-interacting protein C-terminal domain-containing protein n=1 Tax=Arthroderma gypseum (strain ATCC MYA-4604 / CBS 118893) TaxID=535722 RepID=E4UN87_ARTGP|nr:hypothetical protein MGYG_02561 [Nannizzia gypsea CBS 118893]EFQ99548.1 hypothetical protein MGYG_02561 [Nannizzia gypsea CBS 118893]